MSNELFNIEESEVAGSFLEETKRGQDGLLRPKLTEGKNGVRELVIRFLPNFTRDRKLGPSVLEKHIHYAHFPANPNLRGYYDCQKDLGLACPLCDTFWTLRNDKNPEISDRSKKINRTSKYYSYVYVVEDKQVPENEGKIFIYSFGYKIFQKIKAQAENSRKPIRVEDLLNGANLYLKIEEFGGFPNYDASYFEAPDAIEVEGLDIELTSSGKPNKATQNALIDFLLSRDCNIEDFISKEWTPEQHDNVNNIIAILTGQNYTEDSFVEQKKYEAVNAASIFGDDDDDDDEVESISETRSKAEAYFEDEDEEDEETPKAKKTTKRKTKASEKISKYFDDEDDE